MAANTSSSSRNEVDSVKKLPLHKFRCIVLGDSNVGKTSLVNRFHRDTFCDASGATLGVDKVTKSVCLPDGETVQVELWDTAGQERYRSLTSSYYRHVDGIIFVYDVTSPTSFAHIADWKEDVEFNIKDTSRIVKFLVGTKIDLRHDKGVEAEKVKAVHSDSVHGFYEVSCKSGEHVTELLTAMCEMLVRMRQNCQLPRTPSDYSFSIKKEIQPREYKRGKCAC